MTPNALRLPCRCGARSGEWQDHATTCPFARYGAARADARRATRHLVLCALAFGGFVAGVVLAVLAMY